MTSQSYSVNSERLPKPSAPVVVLLTPKEAAKVLKVSLSWLAKARMRGDGPPFIKIGRRAIRYSEAALVQWTKSQQRMSTSED
jgi:predicted DNA-binding transcriptional regulator AlpA